jgi:hypothetical protein
VLNGRQLLGGEGYRMGQDLIGDQAIVEKVLQLVERQHWSNSFN